MNEIKRQSIREGPDVHRQPNRSTIKQKEKTSKDRGTYKNLKSKVNSVNITDTIDKIIMIRLIMRPTSIFKNPVSRAEEESVTA